ncbi:MAG: phosphoenolpyruvate--protein phosphotransferase [Rhodoferax sp.]|nr:phosphoenolpyruvate--protein phosphotransferase [Rhodoferax sp.]OIP22597.1 MAG: phosphoenolpyruvate--protein phosphotransferase [Comamonadaceae bacterium CG2_30_60_41]PIW09382.1 MAG: phosphoenolpyruvate--protein phosphotransferase [Comamonadaceae bacterium CG17_big_fil_post_rev_8_21_14_2_50_60_13]PIY24291.1 MAG: phosphoenolpyruvate--protein phosphotransferase [Comamonadaceae bacterium CG_4_10_14_3_um_filter_60_75]PJC11516.1 MAG: phosphoenolpyruvate--protein phosphotransferase [Comamonadaceae
MTFSIHGLPVARGIAIGRAVLVASSRLDVVHYFIEPAQVEAELKRVRDGRDAVVTEIQRLQSTIAQMGPKETPHELAALLEVHLMLLQDEELALGVRHWIKDRLYNAEWALVSQLEVIARQFDEMQDDYLRERKADLEQITERILRAMRGVSSPLVQPLGRVMRKATQQELLLDDTVDVPLILVAHDLSPADMLQFKQSVFAGFITDVGGKTSHTAIVARSLDIPAVVGARLASQLLRQDDWVIIDGDAGVVVVDPSAIILAEYGFRQRQGELARGRLARLLHTPAVTLDGQKIELLANIEMPDDAAGAIAAGAVGVGLFRSEFLFMGRHGKLPNEEEQYLAYRRAVEGMQGLPVTIRTVDIGADKPLDESARDMAHLNPALGLRAIRWSLTEPAMFLTQLRAILRAAAHGPVQLLIPMLVHASEIRQTVSLIDHARVQLDNRGIAYGPVKIGAMIEIPAAALTLKLFLKYFDFLSIGTNDLIQYTLAIDRADESVAHLYDPLHPAVLRLIANTLAEAHAQGKPVSVCGEMAGDVGMTRLLLGMGLRSFSMHPAQILAVKQEILRADTGKLEDWAQQVMSDEEPAKRIARPA